MTAHFTTLGEAAEAASQLPSTSPVKPEHVRQPGIYRNGGKRVLETLLVLAALPFVLPLIAVLALMVVSDGGRPFYSQMRIGRGGRRFRMWKLRTMVSGADEKLQAYLDENPEARAEWDATQKLKNDPRITRMGKFLRRSSIDELPQLWNVLTGSMSLVGPRPMMVDQQAFYHGKGYYNLRPGITGLWQISDRNESDFAARVKFDDAYDRSISLGTDIKVLFQTVNVVFRCTGY